MQIVKWSAVCLAMLLQIGFLTLPSFATEKMSFNLIPPEKAMEKILGNAWFIFANGEIDNGAAKRLERLIVKNNIPNNSMIFFNSPGGSVGEAMQLGKILRKHKIFSGVAIENTTTQTGSRFARDPGNCENACVLAFIGGHFRYSSQDSKLGFNNFLTSDTGVSKSLLLDPIKSEIKNYITEMGVEKSFFEIISNPDQSIKFEIGNLELEKYNVINNGLTNVEWSFKEIEGGKYLKGERDTQHGVQKIIFTSCVEGDIALVVMIFDAQKREDDIMAHTVEQLKIDDKTIDILPFRDHKGVQNGFMNFLYHFPKDVLDQIEQADHFDFYSLAAADAKLFFGYARFPIADGRKKIRAMRNSCK
jgi:hypothetical protein